MRENCCLPPRILVPVIHHVKHHVPHIAASMKQPPKTQVPASACADTCIGLRRYLHEATQVSALKPHSFTVIAKKVFVSVIVKNGYR